MSFFGCFIIADKGFVTHASCGRFMVFTHNLTIKTKMVMNDDNGISESYLAVNHDCTCEGKYKNIGGNMRKIFLVLLAVVLMAQVSLAEDVKVGNVNINNGNVAAGDVIITKGDGTREISVGDHVYVSHGITYTDKPTVSRDNGVLTVAANWNYIRVGSNGDLSTGGDGNGGSGANPNDGSGSGGSDSGDPIATIPVEPEQSGVPGTTTGLAVMSVLNTGGASGFFGYVGIPNGHVGRYCFFKKQIEDVSLSAENRSRAWYYLNITVEDYARNQSDYVSRYQKDITALCPDAPTPAPKAAALSAGDFVMPTTSTPTAPQPTQTPAPQAQFPTWALWLIAALFSVAVVVVLRKKL